MGKKIMIGLIVLVFVCSSLLVLSSCASKYSDRAAKLSGVEPGMMAGDLLGDFTKVNIYFDFD